MRLNCLILIGLTLFLLSACSPVVETDPDPLGLDNEGVTLQGVKIDGTRLSPSDVGDTVFEGALAAATFSNIDLSDAPRTPKTLEVALGLKDQTTVFVKLADAGGNYPETITLKTLTCIIDIAEEGSNDTGKARVVWEQNIVLNRQTGCTAESCSYTSEDYGIVYMQFGADALGVMTKGSGANTATASFTVFAESSPSLPVGSQLSFNLEANRGRLRF